MKLESISITYGRTQSLRDYCNVKPSMTLTATLEPDDVVTDVAAKLIAGVRGVVHEIIDQALEDDGTAARHSTEPRYRLIYSRAIMFSSTTEHGGYRGVNVEPPDKVIVILPDDYTVPISAEHWTGEPYGVARHMRLHQAHARAIDWMVNHPGTTVINATQDYSVIPPWLLVPAERPADLPEWVPPAYNVDDDDQDDDDQDDDERPDDDE